MPSAVLSFAEFAARFFASMAGASIQQLQVNSADSTGLPSLCMKAYRAYTLAIEMWDRDHAKKE